MSRTGIRLQKFLAQRGVASRRHSEELIRTGRVLVNGAPVTELGTCVDPAVDRVSLDGRTLPALLTHFRTVALHKPPGYVCSTTGQGNRTVYDLLRTIPERLLPAGRLDKDSEGLLILSNDGVLIQRITHPRFEHEKTYQVTVSGPVADSVLKHLRSMASLEDGPIQPAKIRVLRTCSDTNGTVLEFVLREGKKRQIRRMCEKVGLRVLRLVRTQVGTLCLDDLPAGKWRDLTAAEVESLNRSVQ